MQSKAPFIIITVVLVILALGGGYYLGKVYSRNMNSSASNNQNPLFTQQTATIQGQVTSVKGRSLTIKNSGGQEATFPAAPTVFINKMTNISIGSGPLPSPNTNLSSVEIGKEATISLFMNNGQFEVISVTYVVPLTNIPPVPPVSTKSASPSAK